MRSLLSGLASDLRTPVPELWIIDDDAPNALVTLQRGPVVAVSSGLEGALTRTECEAVIAHCMVRLVSGEARSTTRRIGAGPFGPTGREAAQADLFAVAQTRYPPALASAIGKAVPRSGPFAALWFVPDAGDLASPGARRDALGEL